MLDAHRWRPRGFVVSDACAASPLLPCRATAKDVLAHPWVCGNAPSTAIDVNNLKKLQATRKLRKAGAKLMALNRLKNMSIGPK